VKKGTKIHLWSGELVLPLDEGSGAL
jgi:hypothetical protein